MAQSVSQSMSTTAPKPETASKKVTATTPARTSSTTAQTTTQPVITTTQAVTTTSATASRPVTTAAQTTAPVKVQAPVQASVQEAPQGDLVWIPTKGGHKYHSHSSCSNMDGPRQVTVDEAVSLGFTPCKKCY